MEDNHLHSSSQNGGRWETTQLVEQAKAVLDKNWTGSFTKPARSLYPHQWSWDSAFIAIGYAHFNQNHAEKELQRLFSGQWDNGMVPHIVFNDAGDDTGYFPGPKFWKTNRSPFAPDDRATSGICQPPVHATAVRHIMQTVADRARAQAFAADIFPKLKAWHDFLYRERDPEDEGLVYIRHPWSSGQDNAPTWDKVLNRIDLDRRKIPKYQRKDQKKVDSAERPSDTKYDYYVYLLNFFRKRNYDEEKIRQDGCPFMVQDVMFNSLLCRAERDMAQIAEWLGKDPEPHQQRARKTARSINQKLWDENHGIYFDYDLVADTPIEIHMLSGFMPLFGDIPSPVRADRLFNYLNTNSFCRLGTNEEEDFKGIPSYDRQEPNFSTKKYWRGPVWINLNWMLYRGLQRYGHKKYDRLIEQSIIEMSQKSGFCEYYNPDTGEGYGSDDFSWSAALLIDILGSEIEYESGKN